MRIIVSTISHHHEEMIKNLSSLEKLSAAENIVVLCRDNTNSQVLREYCFDNNIIYILNNKPHGFAENNNLNFQYYLKNLSPQKDDYFLLFNPDIELTNDAVTELNIALNNAEQDLLVGNLFLEHSYQVYDDNLRFYPKFSQFIRTFLLNDRSTMINRHHGIPKNTNIWASCAFLALSASNYLSLGGLDERFYMYCEDIDFSRRAQLLGLNLKVAENVKAIHWRQRASKKLFSRYFFWHVMSVMKFCFFSKKDNYLATKSAIYSLIPRETEKTEVTATPFAAPLTSESTAIENIPSEPELSH